MRSGSFILFLLLLLGAGCTSASTNPTSGVMETSQPEEMPLSLPAPVFDAPVRLGPELDMVLEPEQPTLAVSLEAGDYFFAPESFTAHPGQMVEITFAKEIGEHAFVMDELGITEEVVVGERFSFTAPSTPGRYGFHCTVGAHADLGMKGVMIVTE